MGRPLSSWTERAVEVCADGRWHLRDDVLREMIKMVPPGVALRRGSSMSHAPQRRSDRELIERGARHICIVALRDKRLATTSRDGQMFVRLITQKQQPVPIVVDPATRKQATHVLLPIEIYRALCDDLDDVVYVRSRSV